MIEWFDGLILCSARWATHLEIGISEAEAETEWKKKMKLKRIKEKKAVMNCSFHMDDTHYANERI